MIPQIPVWNWWCDPPAVASVLDASHAAPPRIVPGEVTSWTRLQDGDLVWLAGGDALARKLAELSDHWLIAKSEPLGHLEQGILIILGRRQI
jgi:inosine-uridine nucleoside N-ribohydrolase